MIVCTIAISLIFKEVAAESSSVSVLASQERLLTNKDPYIKQYNFKPREVFLNNIYYFLYFRGDDYNTKEIYIRNIFYFLGHERTMLWRKAIQLFLKNPFMGYGLNYQVVEGMLGTHNTFLRVLVSSGDIWLFAFYWSTNVPGECVS